MSASRLMGQCHQDQHRSAHHQEKNAEIEQQHGGKMHHAYDGHVTSPATADKKGAPPAHADMPAPAAHSKPIAIQ